ncbi:nodulation protein NfeD [Chloroflexota bacterium]
MWRKLPLAFLVFGFAWLLIANIVATVSAASDHVAVLEIDGNIDDVSARYLARGIDKATADGAQLVIVKLDTPGGYLSSTRDMVEEIFSADIPVAVYVSPPGAHAASAGTFITAAANFAVMAPGTNIGAASPVASGGEDLPTTLEKKINEDTRAFIRGIATLRNRNLEALEDTVTKAQAYSAEEAVEKGVVDFMANDLENLLAQLDGATAQTASGTVVLHTQGASIREIDMNLLERFLSVLASPNIAFVLLSIGGLGVLIEIFTPGFIGPGVVGVICYALAFVALGNLPVNWVGVGLIIFSVILFFLELQEPGIGIFGIGGVISFLLGAFLLFGGFGAPEIPTPSFRVAMWIIGVIGGLIAAFVLLLVYMARTVKWSPAATNVDAVMGKRGTVYQRITRTEAGFVKLENEEWRASSQEDIEEGEEIEVIGVKGITLQVGRPKE